MVITDFTLLECLLWIVSGWALAFIIWGVIAPNKNANEVFGNQRPNQSALNTQAESNHA